MSSPKFQFSNVVVVDNEEMGVIVKTWGSKHYHYTYDVYVRCYNGVKEYPEAKIKHYVYSKSLSEEEKEFH